MWFNVYFSDDSGCKLHTQINESEDSFIDRIRKAYNPTKIVRDEDGVLVYEKLVQKTD